MSKPIIFISHITEEKEIAKALKEFLDNKFLGNFEVFVSSHPESISLGDEWYNSIKSSIKSCSILIVLCSPKSVSRPWINFEAGAGWVREIPVIPLCHSGLIPGDLPIPLKMQQGGLLSNKNDIEILFKKIASTNNTKAPQLNDDDFFNLITTFETRIKKTALRKDVIAVNNLLSGQINLLKHAIILSTTEFTNTNEKMILPENFRNHKVDFKKLGCVYGLSFSLTYTPLNVYQVFYKIINRLSEEIKFLLSSNHLDLPPILSGLLNSYLFNVRNAENWISYFNTINSSPAKSHVIKHDIEKLKEFEDVPNYQEPFSSINSFIDYYKSLLFYQTWIITYDLTFQNLMSDK